MLSFPDHSRHVPETRDFREIPYHHFDARSTKMDTTTKLLIVTGVAIIAIAGLTMLCTPAATTAFYVASGEMALGVLVIASALITHYWQCQTNSRELQTLPLPLARNVAEYLDLLDLNEGNPYSLQIPDLLEHHRMVSTSSASHHNSLDLGRENIYLLNGGPIPLDETEFQDRVQGILDDEALTEQVVALADREADPIRFKAGLREISSEHAEDISAVYFECRAEAARTQVPPQITPFLNQALFADMLGPIRGRYVNFDLGIQLGMRASSHESTSAVMLIDVIYEEEKWYVNLRQLCQITLVTDRVIPLGYLTAQLRIDPETGAGELSWQSPQSEQQTLT